jgi:hypothetical protein
MAERRARSSDRGPVSRRKVTRVLGEFKDRDLKSSSGTTVTNPKQAIAIALSEGRRAATRR